MLTDYIRSDGRSTDTPTVTSLTWKCVAAVFHPLQDCRRSQMAFAWSRKKKAMTLSVAPAWVLGSLHTSIFLQETVKECWVKVMDKHLNERKRAVDRGIYTDVMLHHLSSNTFCSPDSYSDFAITDLQVAAASIVWWAKKPLKTSRSVISNGWFYNSAVYNAVM